TFSILVRNQAGEVLRAAIQDGDFTAAEHNLTANWAPESLYGGRVRLFTPESLQSLLTTVPLTVIAERGVRVVSDYLPALVARAAEYERMLAVERELGRRPQFAAVARYSQYLTRRSNPAGLP